MDVISWLIMERLVIIFSVISGLWIVKGWRHVWSWLVYLIDPPNFWVSHHWPAGCIKREENVINIAKPCIHKAAGSGINEMLFPIFSWRYMLFIIHEPGLDRYRVQSTTSQFIPIWHHCIPIYSCLHQKILKPMYSCRPFFPLQIVFCQLSVLGFHCFLQHTT